MNPAQRLILVCNAHLDPVWLWEWEEGLAETLSTFRTAARFCEEFDGFIFCHNEALLYQWVEEYDPALFERIRVLVEEKRWCVMGGWYVQPDCNMPSGESLVRQIVVGKRYFLEKLATEPRTAVNLDPFGHTRGLVQILKRSGYTSYLFCRPKMEDLDLPAEDFIWVGYDGSEVLAHLASAHYNSERGKVGEKITQWMEDNRERTVGLLLWGIGNHGGGPSREDLARIAELQEAGTDREILHGRPEDYFSALEGSGARLPKHEGDLNPWAVGCYTSMALVKQKHRRLENRYLATEKIATHAAFQGLMKYPREELRLALEDLLFCAFHDILPGSSIMEVESYALQRMDHALEILSRIHSRAFLTLLAGEHEAGGGEFPIFVWNPHPFGIEEIVVCEFQPPEPNRDPDVFMMPELSDAQGSPVPLQLEKESCNIQDDQRKRIVFRGRLAPSSMTRFSCRLVPVPPSETAAAERDETDPIILQSERVAVTVDRKTGLIDSYLREGVEYLAYGAFRPFVMDDYADPWGMKVNVFANIKGSFRLLSEEECARFAGVELPRLAPVRVIEDGSVRTTVEALFGYRDSRMVLRYSLPKEGDDLEVSVRVFWMEKDRMLKLSVPTSFTDGSCRGQVAYGVEEFDRPGEELVAQKWVGITSGDGGHAVTVINDCIHGFDFQDGELRLSLLRSPAYAGHPVEGDLPIVRQDRFEPRIDQGERSFTLWLEGGPASARYEAVEREALTRNEPPVPLCCHTSGEGVKARSGVTLSDEVTVLSALKLAEGCDRLILRLFEPTGTARSTVVTIPSLGIDHEVELAGFEIRTLAVDTLTGEIFETDLLERRIT